MTLAQHLSKLCRERPSIPESKVFRQVSSSWCRCDSIDHVILSGQMNRTRHSWRSMWHRADTRAPKWLLLDCRRLVANPYEFLERDFQDIKEINGMIVVDRRLCMRSSDFLLELGECQLHKPRAGYGIGDGNEKRKWKQENFVPYMISHQLNYSSYTGHSIEQFCLESFSLDVYIG